MNESGIGCGRGGAVVAIEDEGEQVARVESGVDALQFKETAEHQPRAHQQNKRERDLGCYDDVAHRAASAESGVATDAAQHVHQPRTRCAQCRSHAEENRRRESRERSEGEHRCVDGYGIEARQVGGGERAQLLDSGPGEREPAERPPGGKPHGFREDGRHQSPAIGSERGTDGELAIAQRGTDQQKIGDVGACHEQQKND